MERQVVQWFQRAFVREAEEFEREELVGDALANCTAWAHREFGGERYLLLSHPRGRTMVLHTTIQRCPIVLFAFRPHAEHTQSVTYWFNRSSVQGELEEIKADTGRQRNFAELFISTRGELPPGLIVNTVV